MIAGSISPRGNLNSIVAVTQNYLSQIAQKIDRVEQENLRSLDETVMKYVESRNVQRKPILEELENETLTIDNLDIANLNLLHNQSQCAILNLDQELSQFDKARDHILQQNNRALQNFIISSCGSGGIGVSMAGGQLTNRSGQMTSRSRPDNEGVTQFERVGEVPEAEENGSAEKQNPYIKQEAYNKTQTEGMQNNKVTNSNTSSSTINNNHQGENKQKNQNMVEEQNNKNVGDDLSLDIQSINLDLNLGNISNRNKNGKNKSSKNKNQYSNYGIGMRLDTGRNTDRNNGRKTLLDIVKDLVIQLSKYREIDDIIQEIQETRKKNKNYFEEDEEDLVANVENYLDKIAEVMSSGDEFEEQEEEDDNCYRYYDRPGQGGNHSISISQLQYVE